MDIGTGLALLGSKDLLVKALGPSFDYIGVQLQILTEASVRNIKRVFDAAFRRGLLDHAETGGQVPPRVLMRVIEEAAFQEDPLAAEYLGGVLASSTSGVRRDDRGVVLVALVGRLSTYALRTHYILYTVAYELFAGSGINMQSSADRLTRAQIFIPLAVYGPGMDFVEGEDRDLALAHAMYTLVREDLIDGSKFAWGRAESVRQEYVAPGIVQDGIAFQPTPLGIELYLAAQGRMDLTGNDFLDVSLGFGAEPLVPIPAGACRISDLMTPPASESIEAAEGTNSP